MRRPKGQSAIYSNGVLCIDALSKTEPCIIRKPYTLQGEYIRAGTSLALGDNNLIHLVQQVLAGHDHSFYTTHMLLTYLYLSVIRTVVKLLE